MRRQFIVATVLIAAGALQPLAAQTPPTASGGAMVLMTGHAELELPNDEAVANFYFETQDADLTRAQSQVNQRVGDGTAALKRADPKAQIETSGYSSFPVYSTGTGRNIVGWRVRQGVTLRTENLTALPKTIVAAQPHLAVGGIDFRLSKAAREKVEAQLIQQAIANLNARFTAAAQALGVPASRIRIEEVNFGVRDTIGPQPMMARAAPMALEAATPPTLESGRSIERLTVSGKARLLPQ
jgi:predicted secreted protein